MLALLLRPIGGVGIWAVVALDRTPRGGSPPTETAVEDEELARIRERERERIQRELDERAAESRAEEGPPGFGVATPQAGEEEPVRAVAEPADRETPISDEELERIRDRERERIQRKLEAQTQLILAEEAEQPKPVSKRASEIDRVWATVSETMKEAEEKPADEEVEVEETSAEDWAFLGEAALGGGNCSGAIGNFREAVRKSPVNANYNYKLGLSYHRCGRDDSAMPYLENAAGSIPAARFLLEEIRSGS